MINQEVINTWLDKKFPGNIFVKAVYFQVLFPYFLNNTHIEEFDNLPVVRKVLDKARLFKAKKFSEKSKKTLINYLGNTKTYKRKACFMNSQLLALNYIGFSYVEGYISVCGIPILHAWNLYKGKLVDTTIRKDVRGKDTWDNKNIGTLDREYFGLTIDKPALRDVLLKTKRVLFSNRISAL